MDIKNISIIVIILILLYVLIRYVAGGSAAVHTGVASALETHVIKASALAAGTSLQSAAANFSHCIWFYIDDWNYNYGTYKPLLVRAPAKVAKEPLVKGLYIENVCPAVILGAHNNTIDIYQTIFNVNGAGENTHTVDDIDYNLTKVSNVPIQKWCCLIVSFNGRTCDVYLDGKLIRTTVMANLAKVDKSADMKITPVIDAGTGSFKGWTSNYQFISDSINPQQAYDIYKKGFGQNWLSSLLNVDVTVSVSKNGKVTKEVSF
jgi:hypothetical protein